jgi:hypothetical protein
MLILHSLRGVQSCVNIIILTNDEVNQMTQSDFKALQHLSGFSRSWSLW